MGKPWTVLPEPGDQQRRRLASHGGGHRGPPGINGRMTSHHLAIGVLNKGNEGIRIDKVGHEQTPLGHLPRDPAQIIFVRSGYQS